MPIDKRALLSEYDAGCIVSESKLEDVRLNGPVRRAIKTHDAKSALKADYFSGTSGTL